MYRFLLIALFLISFCPTLWGQWAQTDKNLNIISQEQLRTHVRILSDTTVRGRSSGTIGALISAQYIKYCFEKYGLQPYHEGSWVQSFRIDNNLIGRNVMAMVKGGSRSDEYLIISAHYDHIGMINGVVYPGADKNASGVALLLQIAQIFGQRARLGDPPARTILFIAYDAKEYNMAGSAYFAKTLSIPPHRIIANLNIDQIGCVLEPPNQDPAYLLVLGADRLSTDLKDIIDAANHYPGIELDLDYTFYGSAHFLEIFYKLGDHIHLANKQIPSVLFTSGFHAYTYKPTDLPALLHYPVLERRARLIYLIANNLASRWSLHR